MRKVNIAIKRKVKIAKMRKVKIAKNLNSQKCDIWVAPHARTIGERNGQKECESEGRRELVLMQRSQAWTCTPYALLI